MTVKWQSRRLPGLVLYDEHYQDMRQRYIHIRSFRDEMVALENWLLENPERRPKTARGWKKQVGNWCRLADKYAKQKYERALATGKVKELKMNNVDAGLRLSQILKRAEKEKQKAEVRGQKSEVGSQKSEVRGQKSEVKSHADPVGIGEALKIIGGNNG